MNALEFRAGPKALARLRQHGLQARDVALIPAAAGGPKGLILQALDQWLFGAWLPAAPRQRTLIGASIGAWRMAAACHADPVTAFQRLGDFYCGQRYPKNPSPQLVSSMCRQLLNDVVAGHEAEIIDHRQYHLHILTVRGKGLLQAPQGKLAVAAGYAGAALANLWSRRRLANHLERVVIGDARDSALWMKAPFDDFPTHFTALSRENLGSALLASGTLPMVMQPVSGIPGAPPGTYWDGGIIDYHLALPYARIEDEMRGEMHGGAHGEVHANLVLYPHFGRKIVPGWLDKALPWRHAPPAGQRDWYDYMLLVSPSRAFLHTLPRAKLPDRQDFHHYGLDHDARIVNWKKAIGEGQRLRDEFARFAEKPDVSLVQAL